MKPPPTWHAPLAAAILIAAALIAYWPVLNHDFIGIDYEVMVARNPDVNPPTMPGVLRYWSSSARSLYMPLTYTLWAWTAQAAYSPAADPRGLHLSPAWFHALNLALHAAAALAVLALLTRLTGHVWPALLGALLFALHPVQVEAVAWVAETKDLLAGLLSIVALWQYVLFATTPRQPGYRITASTHYVLAMAAFALAMFAKPSAVVAPVMAVLIDVILLRRSFGRAIVAVAPALLVAIVIAIVAASVQRADFARITGAPRHVTWPARLLVAGDAVSFYLYKLVLPLNLGLDYGRSPWEVLRHSWVWLTAAIPLILAIMLWRQRSQLPGVTIAAALFAVGVLPVLGMIPFDFQEKSTVADHYLYLSMLGPALALTWCLARWPKPAVLIAAILILVALGVRTWFQTWHWRDSMTCYRHGVEVNPRSWWLRGAVAFEHEKAGRLDDALVEFNECLTIAPQYATAHAHVGAILLTKGRPAEAIEHLQASLAFNPDQPQVQTLLDEARRISRNP